MNSFIDKFVFATGTISLLGIVYIVGLVCYMVLKS